ncbi:hypothetical protein [Fusobacterium ulcerans]|uniref:hypothetical protein n=1 Tax=Fusobacterium ulcerans TaxID=861 RepID=UPI0026DC5D94|nr:hypothetical protein [Fusobacterium ulcerans]
MKTDYVSFNKQAALNQFSTKELIEEVVSREDKNITKFIVKFLIFQSFYAIDEKVEEDFKTLLENLEEKEKQE